MVLNNIKSTLNNRKTEFIIFTFFVLLNSSFLLCCNNIHSLDGPQHLYNSNVICELLQGNNTVSEYFSLNRVPVGYLTGPVILSALNALFPANIALKILVFICIAGLAYSFRYMVYSINKVTTYTTLLIIPFTLQTFLGMGYFTFSLSLAFYFICIGYVIRNFDSLRFKNLSILGFLLLMTYFTHMVVFSFTMGTIALFVVFRFLREMIQRNQSVIKRYLIIAMKIAIASLPAVVLAVIYAYHVFKLNTPIPNPVITTTELYRNVFIMKNLIAFDLTAEAIMGKTIFFVLIAAFSYVLIVLLHSVITKGKQLFRSGNGKSDRLFFFCVAVLFFIMYVFMPNVVGTGAVSMRVLVLFYLVFVLFLALQKYSPVFLVLMLGVIFYSSVQRSYIASDSLKSLSRDVDEIMEMNDYMEPNSTYFAMNYSTYWQHSHIDCYIGVDKPLINLANPQCLGHFPVVWENKLPCLYLGNHASHELGVFWNSAGIDRTIHIIDYFVVWGYGSFINEKSSLKTTIDNYYELVAVSSRGNAALYRFKLGSLIDESLEKMKKSPEWLAQLQRKAQEKQIPLHNAMLLDIFYLIDYYNLQAKDTN